MLYLAGVALCMTFGVGLAFGLGGTGLPGASTRGVAGQSMGIAGVGARGAGVLPRLGQAPEAGATGLFGWGQPSAFRSYLKNTFGSLALVKRARQRAALVGLAQACEQQMPELLDILALGLSAGLSFDASLELYCAHSAARLSHELFDTMLSWQMGLSGRAAALQSLAARIDSVSLKHFCASVCEALAFGAPLAATLERQADLMREEQKALVQEHIEEVPVRMLVPLGTLVVPAMLLAVLGPLLSGALSI